MTALVLLDQGADPAAHLDWALRLATARDPQVCVMLPEGLDAAGEHEVVHLPAGDPIDATLSEVRARSTTLLVFVQPGGGDGAADERRRRLTRDAPCELIALRPAEEAGGGGVLVAASSGPHAEAALRLGRDLAGAGVAPVDALYVEPPVGWGAERVGQRILDRHVRKALADGADALGRSVVVHAEPHVAIAEQARERGAGLLLLGAARTSALGQRLRRTVGQRVRRGAQHATVGLVRAALPLHGRFTRRLEALLQRRVPQLDREERVSLVERVQGSSHWDFDFVTLMSLATLIAALGLVQDSAAVIIGAMLVAPLMTPVLGLGLALTQGNDRLAAAALRTVALGFVTAFGLGLLTGWVHQGFGAPTAQMRARDWPDLTDLVIAFVAGMAAAYASCRPGLIAALPGVAIAAALVPPIASAGLALSVGEWRLAAGALLLFLVNTVAIVFATAISLWAVGLRYDKGSSRRMSWVRWGTTVLLLALGVGLATG